MYPCRSPPREIPHFARNDGHLGGPCRTAMGIYHRSESGRRRRMFLSTRHTPVSVGLSESVSQQRARRFAYPGRHGDRFRGRILGLLRWRSCLLYCQRNCEKQIDQNEEWTRAELPQAKSLSSDTLGRIRIALFPAVKPIRKKEHKPDTGRRRTVSRTTNTERFLAALSRAGN